MSKHPANLLGGLMKRLLRPWSDYGQDLANTAMFESLTHKQPQDAVL